MHDHHSTLSGAGHPARIAPMTPRPPESPQRQVNSNPPSECAGRTALLVAHGDLYGSKPAPGARTAERQGQRQPVAGGRAGAASDILIGAPRNQDAGRFALLGEVAIAGRIDPDSGRRSSDLEHRCRHAWRQKPVGDRPSAGPHRQPPRAESDGRGIYPSAPRDRTCSSRASRPPALPVIYRVCNCAASRWSADGPPEHQPGRQSTCR